MKKIFSMIMVICVACVANAANYLTFTAEEDSSSFGMQETPDLWYSLDDGATWNALEDGDMVVLKKKGDKALLKGVNSDGISFMDSKSDFKTYFLMTGKIAASGSVMSLIDGVGETTVVPSIDCFARLFFNCASLTQAPELTATTLAEDCYYQMFSGCTSLTKAPELPAKTLVHGCYLFMFSECTNLTQVPDLLATTMAEICCKGMFEGCTSLTQAPELPAMTLAENCYDNMFNRCRNLTKAPSLPATTLASGCYNEMFSGCKSLTQAPELPAKALAPGCYYRMFYNCENLTKAPELNATVLANGCYSYMFDGCPNLSEVKVSFTEWGGYAKGMKTMTWLPDVPSTGLFICPASLPLEFNDSRIPKGWNVKYLEVEEVENPNCLTFIDKKDGSVLGYVNVGKASSISYSLDEGETWVPIPEGEWNVLVNDDDIIMLKGVESAFQRGEWAGVSSAFAGKTMVWTEGRDIYVSGANGKVSLYDFSGRCVSTSIVTSDLHTLTAPAQGIYFIKTEKETFSVLVR